MSKMVSNSKNGKGRLFAFRTWSPYIERVTQTAEYAKLTPNQLARVATMFFVDSGVLELRDSMRRIEDELIRLRRDFNDAIEK